MKIAHVIESMNPLQGGPPMSVARLAAAQAGLGHDVAILCPSSTIDGGLHVSFKSIPHIDSVEIIPCPLTAGLRGNLGFVDESHLKSVLERFDMIHLQGLWQPILSSSARIALMQGKPYAVAPRGMLAPWSLRQKRWRKFIALGIYWKTILRNATMLHVLNSDEALQIADLQINTPIETLPNGIFPEEIGQLPPQSEFYQRHKELKGRPFILFLGRLHHVKGLDVLLAAYELVAAKRIDLDLVIAGPDGGMRETLERDIQRRGLTDRVFIVGSLYGIDKFSALVDAQCLCQPSRQEGFSMAITEALACGLPAVISRHCHFPEVGEVGAGEVVDLDENEIAAALLSLLGDDKRRRSAGKAGRELVLSRFTWPRIADASIIAYERALAAV